jgi:hypothetical protein
MRDVYRLLSNPAPAPLTAIIRAADEVLAAELPQQGGGRR